MTHEFQSTSPVSLLVEVLREIRELIDDYVDIKDGEGGPMPNNAMRATQLISEALRRVTGSDA